MKGTRVILEKIEEVEIVLANKNARSYTPIYAFLLPLDLIYL